MPLFDFYCPKCHNVFEELVIGEAKAPCPHCGNAATERRVSAPSPLKTGAFPYKVGPVHPLAKKMSHANAGCGGGGCGSCPSGGAGDDMGGANGGTGGCGVCS